MCNMCGERRQRTFFPFRFSFLFCVRHVQRLRFHGSPSPSREVATFNRFAFLFIRMFTGNPSRTRIQCSHYKFIVPHQNINSLCKHYTHINHSTARKWYKCLACVWREHFYSLLLLRRMLIPACRSCVQCGKLASRHGGRMEECKCLCVAELSARIPYNRFQAFRIREDFNHIRRYVIHIESIYSNCTANLMCAKNNDIIEFGVVRAIYSLCFNSCIWSWTRPAKLLTVVPRSVEEIGSNCDESQEKNK